MGGPEFQEILFWTTNKPPKWILGGSTFHSSGRIHKESDDRGMQFAAEFLKAVEDSIFWTRKWKSSGPWDSLHQIDFGPPPFSRIPIFPESKRVAPGRSM